MRRGERVTLTAGGLFRPGERVTLTGPDGRALTDIRVVSHGSDGLTLRREAIMGGWKTWAAGIGMILTGAGLALKAVTAPEDAEPGQLMDGIQLALAGLATIGIGHKVEKAGQ